MNRVIDNRTCTMESLTDGLVDFDEDEQTGDDPATSTSTSHDSIAGSTDPLSVLTAGSNSDDAQSSQQQQQRPTTQLDDDILEDLGLMFAGQQPSRHIQVNRGGTRVVLEVADGEPGALQSGHYLWPGSELLAEFIVEHGERYKTVKSILELGAGCGLVSLTSLQIWRPTLQCVIVTDHDSGTLERARDNYEMTLEAIYETACSEEELDTAISTVGSIPVLFETLEWENDGSNLQAIREQLSEHTTSARESFDLVLGSDLIYSTLMIEPLLLTATSLMNQESGCFLLSQSYAFEEAVEKEIEGICRKLGLSRHTLLEENRGRHRIQEYRVNPPPQEP